MGARKGARKAGRNGVGGEWERELPSQLEGREGGSERVRGNFHLTTIRRAERRAKEEHCESSLLTLHTRPQLAVLIHLVICVMSCMSYYVMSCHAMPCHVGKGDARVTGR